MSIASLRMCTKKSWWEGEELSWFPCFAYAHFFMTSIVSVLYLLRVYSYVLLQKTKEDES